MKASNWTHWIALGALVAGGCAGAEMEDEGGRGGFQEGVYRYVLGHNDDLGVPIFGGAHEVVIPTERGKEEAIDAANKASRLHKSLKGDYETYDPNITDGETDFNVFASSWWSQAGNGIANQWYDDEPGPTQKYDLLVYPGQEQQVPEVEHWYMSDLRKPASERGDKHKHEAITVPGPATKWELQNHGLYQTYAHPDSWWGHCNGWASYATTEPDGFPKRDVTVKLVDGKVTECTGPLAGADGCVTFRMGDIEALMTELYFSDQATFSGRRCNKDPDEIERDEYGRPVDVECRDLNAGSLHIAVTGLLGRGADYLFPVEGGLSRPAFVIDHNWDWEVWNFPLVKFKIDQQEEISKEKANELIGANGSRYEFNAAATRFVRVKMRYWMVSDGVSSYKMRLRADQRNVAPHEVELNYVLELDDSGKILGGEWIKNPETTWGEDNKKLHPDFMWMAVNHKGWGEQADDTGGNDDNPYISYTIVKQILRCANDAATCAPAGGDTPPPPPAGPTCEGHCGGQNAADNCWCDDACSQYGDCCPDYEAVCTAGGGDDTPTPAPAPSCEGHCGSSSAVPGSSPACYCDSACEGYGDCCSDYPTVCTSNG
ncbi:MAG: hypothetical protein D6689_01000 [Deltaproteobacteria bacterium]|nr:MAG: hypothetical protein D6689_01000 [Deltaproteobacteria bacterium]